MTWSERFSDVAYGLGWAGLSKVPHAPSRWVGDVVADLAARRPGTGTRQYARNLYRVLSYSPAGPSTAPVTPAELHETVRQGLRSYARYWLEAFQVPSMDLDEVAERALATSTGIEHARRAVESGRGMILALPHSGNWDVAGLMVCRTFGGLTAVAERLQPESVYRRFVSYRERLGMEIVPLTGGDRPASAILRERLTAGGIVCLLGDRDITGDGIGVDFFGEPTTMPGGPAMLAALTGADLLRVHITYPDEHNWTVAFSAPLELPGSRLKDKVRGGTQLLADGFARDIAKAPHDWHMLQPFWTADRVRVS